jgi:hypothetical protein
MAVTMLPDLFGAILSKLRASSAVTALVSDRIGDEVKPAWDFQSKRAKLAVVVNGPVGGPGELEQPLYRERYDLWCYGPDRLNALKLARTVRAALVPPDGGRAGGFRYGDCYVHEVAEEAGPIRLIDPDLGWVYVVQPYVFTFSGVPAS